MSMFEEIDYNKKFDLQLWKKLLGYIRPYRKSMVILSFVMIGVGGIDAIFPLMTRYAIDHFIVKQTTRGIGWFGLVYFLLVCLQVFNVFNLIAIAGKVDMGVCYDIRRRGFQKLQELAFTYFDRTPVGWIMARMTSDIQRLGDTLAWGLVDMVWGGTMMLCISIFMLYLNWKLALVTLTVLPLLIIISVYFQQKILKAHRQVRKTNSRITGAFNEGIMGAKTTKTLVTEEKNLDEFKGLTGTMFRSSVISAIFSSVYMPIVMTLGSIGTAAAIWYGGRGVLLEAVSYGTLVAFISYTVQFFEPVRELARVLAEMLSAQASAERVISMIETDIDIEDKPEIISKFGDVFNPIRENWPSIKGDISFRNVTFEYKDGEKVLDSFSLEIRAGETIALVGETGSGKSTLVNLACRFYEPSSGQILIDGVDYRDRSILWLQSNLGYVLQTPHLFSGSVRDNIRYGRLDATDEEIEEAAGVVNAHEFITALEEGYDTDVGEGGNRLSTGQKQLISLARAILANPAIFVLDEATSSVDTETEQMIQMAIQKVLQGRTSFVVAHRLSTIRSADRILVIQKGRIVEEGSHQQLLGLRGYYYKLYTNQFMDEQEVVLINE